MDAETETSVDAARQEAFGDRMLQVVNDALQGMLLSVGHRTGLFDQLAELLPATSQQIAEAAGLDERYVREWLGGMTVARIVDYYPTDATYRLPPEHASFLTRAAGPDNFAFFMQYLALIGKSRTRSSRPSARAAESPTAPTPSSNAYRRKRPPASLTPPFST